jgi:hypothetical protein
MRKIVLTLLLVIAALASPVMADGKKGLMVGGSVGASLYDISDLDGSSVKLDDTDFAWKVFLGYRFGLFAIEADYRDFGKVTDASAGQRSEYSTQAFDLSAAVMVPIGPFDIIGRVGASNWDGDASVSGVDVPSLDGTSLMYGVGGAFRLGSVAIRLEIERFEFDPDPVNMVSLGASFTF